MRRLLAIVACLLITGLAFADKVSETEALKKAQAFMPGERFEVQKYSTSVGGKTVEEPFYIFNATNGRGYVLVSGNDQTTPILGYSTNGNIDLDNIPDNLRYWLESYAAQLKAIEEGTPAATPRAKTRGTQENIEPLIQTLWNQDGPYNLMCPDGDYVEYGEEGYNPRNRCVTGCVATAVAQVMYYHQWPQQTTAIPSYSFYNNRTINIHELPATTFEWNKMKTTYSKTDTDEAAYAVAKLMRYVGHGLNMRYGIAANGGSGTIIYEDALVNYFGDSKKIHTKDRDGYTTTQWENMVYDELRHGRPVLYSGFTAVGGGHQFVCDGYKDGMFSLNWGWGGKLNGYFVLSVADPNGQQGIGGSTGGYRLRQKAVFNFMPAEANEEEVPILKSNNRINNFQASNYTRENASEDFSGVVLPWGIEAWYSYIPTTTYDAEMGWGLYQGDELKQCLITVPQTIDMRQITSPTTNYVSFSGSDMINPFGANLSGGKYQLRQIFRKAGSNDDWTLTDNYGINYLVAEISGNTLTVRAWETITSEFTVNSINVPDVITTGEPFPVTVNLTNRSETFQQQVSLWSQKDGTATWTKVATATGYVDPDLSGDVVLTYTLQTGGIYHLKVTNDDSEESLAETTITVTGVQEWTDPDSGLNFSYIEGSGKATLIKGDYKTMTSVNIPANITISNNQYAVTAIADEVFKSCGNLTKIILPEGIQTIGSNVFDNCYLLQKLELPSTLSSIGNNVIYGCNALSTVVSHVLEPFYIDDLTFVLLRQWNKNTQQYDYTPSSATLYVPAGTKSAYQTFTGWTIFNAIEEGEVKETTVEGLNYLYYTVSKKATVVAGDYQQLTRVEIPATIMVDNVEYAVKSIGERAFFQCGFESISLPDGLETIGNQAFWNCSNLKSVTLPEGLESIGNEAFYSCIQLETLVLPSTLKSIGESAFNGNGALKEVTSLILDPFDIHDNTFMYKNAASPATLYIPIGSGSKYQAITGWTMFQKTVEGEEEEKEAIVNGLNYSYSTKSKKATVIAGDYGSMTTLEIPATVTFDDGTECSVTAIGDKAFWNCSSLTTVVLPEGIQTLGLEAFTYCFGLKYLELPSTLESIGERAFYGNNSLVKVISHIQEPFDISDDTFKNFNNPCPAKLFVPVGTESKYQAITGWTMFQKIVEGEEKETTVDGLNYLYFTVSKKATVVAGDYKQLTRVEIPTTITVDNVEYTITSIDAEVFRDCRNITSFSLPDGLETIGKSAFMNCTRIPDFSMPSCLKSIGDQAFYQCYGLTNVILPEGLETVGTSAFSGCLNLETLELPSTLKSIGSSAFFRDGSLTEVVSYILTPLTISDDTFMSNYSSPSSATLHVPTGTMEAYQAITGWTMFQAIVEGVEKETTFNGLNYSYSTGSKRATVIAGDYTYLYTAEIPSTITVNNVEYAVKAIAADAFRYCRNLYHVSLPDGLETIGDYAFLGNISLGDIDFPSHLKSIGESAFSSCKYVRNVILPEGLETIGAWAFEACGVQRLELPSSLTSIGEGAFFNEESLKEVISHIPNPLDINENTFMNFDELSPATLYVPAGTKSDYEAIEGWTKFEGGIKVKGDTNGDGSVGTSDAIAALSYILGDNPADFFAAAADMNGDGIVTVTDIILLLIAVQLIP